MTRLLASLLAIVALVGCAGTPDPKTVAEARPELVVAYEAAFRAWVYLDARNAALYEQRAEMTRDALVKHIEAFAAECGENTPACMTAAYDDLMADWEKESGYDKRTVKLELARKGLAAMRALLSSDPNGDLAAWAPALVATLNALTALGDEMVKGGVPLPDVVAAGLTALRRLA